MKNCIIYTLLSLLFFSCTRKEPNYVFEGKPDLDLHNVKMNEVFALENSLHSVVKEKDTFFNIGTFHYPNIKSLTHKVFKRKDSKLYLETDYYYTKKDSLLKVILYDWNIYNTSNGYITKAQYEEKVDNNIIKKKYDSIKKSISLELGNDFKKSSPFENMTAWENKKVTIFISIIGFEKMTRIHMFVGKRNLNNRIGDTVTIEVDTSSIKK